MSTEFAVKRVHASDRRSPTRFIWSYVRRYPWIAFWILVGAWSNAAFMALAYNYIGDAFGAIETSEVLGREAVLAAVAAAAWAIVITQSLRAVLQLVRNFGSELYGQRIERDVRDELYGDLLGKSMAFHDKSPVGEVMARVTNDVRELNLMMNPGFNLIIGSGMFLLMPLFFTPFLSWQLMLTPALFTVLYVLAQIRFVRALHPVAQQQRRAFGVMNARLAETLDGIEVVKGASREEPEAAAFSALAGDVETHFVRQSDIEAVYWPLLLFGLATLGGFAHSLYLAWNNMIPLATVVTFTGYISLYAFPVNVSLAAFSQVALGYASAKRILETLNTETLLDHNPGGHEAALQGMVVFRGVSFGYDPGTEVLHDLSFEVQPGQTVAIVGQTGAGKSTLTKLINRTYDVTSGQVLVDGVDVQAWNLAALRQQISIIEQDIFLFSRTIRENIAFGVPDATQERIEAAARSAQAHDFIMSFPQGYDTVVGQRGVTLSGGQRQRIAIARAFLTDPGILILDDSTSAIDSATEDQIQRAIWAAAQGRTTLLITHRLSQIRWADHIVVVRNGRVVAQGTHEQLLAGSEPYQRVFARYAPAQDPVAAPANGHQPHPAPTRNEKAH